MTIEKSKIGIETEIIYFSKTEDPLVIRFDSIRICKRLIGEFLIKKMDSVVPAKIILEILERRGIFFTKRLAFQAFREAIQELDPTGECSLKRVQGRYVFFNMTLSKESNRSLVSHRDNSFSDRPTFES